MNAVFRNSIVLFLFLVHATNVFSQDEFTIVQNFTGNNAADIRGQIFTSISQGSDEYVILKNIQVIYSSGAEAETIYLHSAVPADLSGISNTGSDTFVAASAGKTTDGLYTIYNFKNTSILVDHAYYALFDQDVNLEFGAGNPYAGGTLMKNTSGALTPLSGGDLKFIITLEVPPTPEIEISRLESGESISGDVRTFPTTLVGSTSKFTYRIANIGDAALHVTFDFPDEAFKVADSSPQTIEGNSFFDLDIYFEPDAEEYYDSHSFIRSDDADEGEFQLVLFGEGQNIVDPPTSVFAAPYSKSEIKLSWGFSNYTATDFYELERKTSDDNSFKVIALISGSTRSFVDDSLTTTKMYLYRLRGKIGDNYSPYSQIVSAAPSSSANTGDWETIAPFANSAEDSSYRFGPISFSINEKGYVGLGCFPTTVNYCDFKEYDPSTDTWKRKADFPGACRSYAANFVINGEAYVGLGGDAFNPVVLKDFYKYNPSTDTWSAIADFPGNPRLYSLSFSINGKGYVCLGQANDTGFTDVYEYDPLHNTWRKVADAPAPGDRSKPLVIDNKAYVFTNDTTYVFEPGLGETGTWTKRGKCPDGIAEASFVINGISYVFFGDGMHWSFYSYDTANDEWGQKNDFPGYGNSEVASFAIGDFGYIGLGSSNGPAAEFWKFTTVSPKPGSFRSTFDQEAETVELQWVDNSDFDEGYVIERRLIFDTDVYTQIAEIGQGVQFYRDADVESSTQYDYRIYSKYPDGNSIYSNLKTNTYKSIIPVAAVNSKTIDVTWKFPQFCYGWLEKAESATIEIPDSFAHVTPVGTATSYTDTVVLDERFYFYRVIGRTFGNGDIAPAKPTIAVRIKSPTNCQAEFDTDHHVILSWADNSGIESAYVVERRKANTQNFEEIARLPANSIAYLDTTVEFFSYQYRVKAIVSALASEYSNIADGPVVTSISKERSPLSLYPNPTTGLIAIENPDEITGITIYDLSGASTDVYPDKNKSFRTINISNFPQGIYFLKVSTRKDQITSKIILLKN